MSKIEDEALILEVEKHPHVYNPILNAHKNKKPRRNTWIKIGNLFCVARKFRLNFILISHMYF